MQNIELFRIPQETLAGDIRQTPGDKEVDSKHFDHILMIQGTMMMPYRAIQLPASYLQLICAVHFLCAFFYLHITYDYCCYA